MPALWLNRIPLETGAAAPRVSVGDVFFSKKSLHAARIAPPRFINMDCGPTTPTGAHIYRSVFALITTSPMLAK